MNIMGFALQTIMKRRSNGMAMSVLKVQKLSIRLCRLSKKCKYGMMNPSMSGIAMSST